MKINEKPFVFKYTNNQEDSIAYVISPDKSEENSIHMYAQFVNGLFIGTYYSIIEIYRLMDNGYKWTTA